jgi:tetratricopeptide (TPR) repeat protein
MELVILAGALAVGTVTIATLRRTLRPLGNVPLAVHGAALAVLWTAFQLLPLPCGWMKRWHPARMSALLEVSGVNGLEPFPCTISMAPGATRAALALAAALLLLLLITIALSRAGHRELLMRSVAVSSVTMALAALAHTALRADRIFDLYTPHARGMTLIAPLINTNHLAGHLALGLPMCLAQALRAKRLDLRMAWLGATFVVLTTGLFSLSRGGATALMLGAGGYLLFHLLRARRQVRRGSSAVLVLGSLSVIAVIAAAAYFTMDLLAGQFGDEDATRNKLRVMRELLPLIAEYPVLGVGRGALEDASPAVVSGSLRIAYAENLPIQWAVDWGVPVSVGVFALCLASLIGARPKRSSEWAMAFGFLALCLQNLVDFSLELAGVSCVAAVALGTLLGAPQRAARTPRSYVRPPLRLAAVGGCLVAAVSLVSAAPVLFGNGRADTRERLQRLLDGTPDEFARALATAVRHYPLDPSLALQGAAHSARINARSTGRRLNLAMTLAPAWPAPHVQAAYFLERRGALLQAASELRLALELQPDGDPRNAAEAFIGRHPSEHLAREVLPESSTERLLIADRLIEALFFHAKSAEAEAFIRFVINQLPGAYWARLRLVDLALRMDDLAAARQRAEDLVAAAPENPVSMAAWMRVLTREGRPREALKVFDSIPSRLRTNRIVLIDALSAAGAAGDSAQIADVTDDLLSHYGTNADERSWIHASVAAQYEASGNLGQALAHAQQSYELSGNMSSLEQVHRIAQRAGMLQVALRAAAEMCHVGHRREAYCQRSSIP